MGKAPAVVIVVRHGARLDAADPQWHLTSPTPYDPPLTYGGWKQAQALGARIGSIVRLREENGEDISSGNHATPKFPPTRRRKHKIIVHSSPYLRCVQTSIALSAGIDNWIGKIEADKANPAARHHNLHSGSPHVHALDPKSSPHLSAIPEPEALNTRAVPDRSPQHNISHERPRSILRLDPFLGEWLSPDYFEDITSPPGSKMMVAGAKAELLRRGEPIESLRSDKDEISSSPGKGSFPGGWISRNRPKHEEQRGLNGGKEEALPDIGHPPKLARAKTHSVATGRSSHRQISSWMDNDHLTGGMGYLPPTPPYAISPVQPIPRGYVAHARDACVKVDFQWDSLKPPLAWGNGGEYGESWSSMHMRFRKGLFDMISWYQEHDALQEPADKLDDLEELHQTRTESGDKTAASDEDVVLVLVTHGAGCNALIGALTNQPVLIDVGLASLTMATRKNDEQPEFSPSSTFASSAWRRRSSIGPSMTNNYDVVLTASTDHLRPGSHFLGGSALSRARSPSLPIRPKSPYRYERNVGSPTRKPTHGSPIRERLSPEPKRITEGSFEEVVRSPTLSQTSTPTSESSKGLWSKPVDANSKVNTPIPVQTRDEKKEQSVHIQRGRSSSQKLNSNITPSITSNTNSAPRPLAQRGLWTAETKGLGPGRDQTTPKRRWTMGQA